MSQYPHFETYVKANMFSFRKMKNKAENPALNLTLLVTPKASFNVPAIQTLFNASNLYLTTDLNRSISVLITAIEIVNQTDGLDLQTGDQTMMREIRGRGFRRLLPFYIPGLDLESALRELAKVEFDVALSQATALTDKSQRTMATLSVIEVCVGRTKDLPRQNSKRRTSVY
jgi:hypothetical protein